VKLEQYKNTFFYFAAMFTSVAFLFIEPTSMLALFSLFNNWNITTIIEFTIYWMLSLYTVLLEVATVEIQAVLLTIEVYVRGLVMFLLLGNLFQIGYTFYFFLESIQFKISDPLDRTGYNTTTMDLIYWSMIKVVPRIVMLTSMHLFFVDIIAYFESDPGKANNLYRPLLLSGLIDWVVARKDDFVNWSDKIVALAQNWVVGVYIGYLTPDILASYVTNYILTPVFTFIKVTVLQVEKVTIPTAED
jgi:hypothetical protein